MGSGTHCLKIDGFPGTHGTHANGATELAIALEFHKIYELTNSGPLKTWGSWKRFFTSKLMFLFQ